MDDAARDSADLWLINSCTVKGPSQAGMSNLIAAGKTAGKHVVVAGCVPQVSECGGGGGTLSVPWGWGTRGGAAGLL